MCSTLFLAVIVMHPEMAESRISLHLPFSLRYVLPRETTSHCLFVPPNASLLPAVPYHAWFLLTLRCYPADADVTCRFTSKEAPPGDDVARLHPVRKEAPPPSIRPAVHHLIRRRFPTLQKCSKPARCRHRMRTRFPSGFTCACHLGVGIWRVCRILDVVTILPTFHCLLLHYRRPSTRRPPAVRQFIYRVDGGIFRGILANRHFHHRSRLLM